jgi:hypothetical protein
MVFLEFDAPHLLSLKKLLLWLLNSSPGRLLATLPGSGLSQPSNFGTFAIPGDCG